MLTAGAGLLVPRSAEAQKRKSRQINRFARLTPEEERDRQLYRTRLTKIASPKTNWPGRQRITRRPLRLAELLGGLVWIAPRRQDKDRAGLARSRESGA